LEEVWFFWIGGEDTEGDAESELEREREREQRWDGW
jgi:hypothetical protein